MERGRHVRMRIMQQNGVLHTLKIQITLKKWRLGEVNIFENYGIVEMRLRKWSGFMCK